MKLRSGHRFITAGGLGLLLQISPAWSQTVSSGPTPAARALASQMQAAPDQAGVGQPPAPADRIASVTPSLLANANYWRSHGEPKVALNDLQRILAFQPDNPDVLAAAAEVAMEVDDNADAAKYKAALLRVAPNDPRNAALAAEHARTPAEAALLADARKLAKSGNLTDAVAKYKELFKGTVPPSLALEYYDVLGSSSSEGFDEAHDKLGAMAEAAPGDDPLQLAYAKLLTRSEDTRNEGIRMLTVLAKKPDVSKTAREAWREVLLWQGPSEKARSQIDAYLVDNPTDPAIEAKRKAFDDVLPDESTRDTMRGYYDAANDPAKAEAEFRAALKANPNNPEALVMVAGILRSKGRPAEAQLLIDKAISIAPDRKDELLKSAGGDYPGLLPLNVQEQVEISRLTQVGEYDHAEKLLTRLYQGRETVATTVQLGNIQLRAGQLDDAEKTMRQARVMDPRSGDAACGLADVLGRKGNFTDAEALLNEASGLYAKARSSSGARRVALSRAGLLEDQAANLDSAAAITLYQTALASDPRNIYVRADLAKAMAAAGQIDQASAVMAKGVDAARGDRQGVQIATDMAKQFADQLRVNAEIKAAQEDSLRALFQVSNAQPAPAPR